MQHHSHYTNFMTDGLFLEEIKNNRLQQPMFIGQGWSKSVGSDVYGGYVVSQHTVGRKTVWGLVHAHTEFGTGGWTDGTELCCLPDGHTNPADCTPTEYIIQSGVWKRTGLPKFYFCDKDGNKFNGRKCCYGWNGAYSFRDPSF